MSVWFPNNNLDPGTKPWGRDVERKIKDLYDRTEDTASRQGNSAAGVQGSLQRMAEQIASLDRVVAELPIILTPAFMSTGSFAFTNTNLVTRATATITPPAGATFGLILGDVTLNAGSSTTPSSTQIINHQMNMSYPLAIGGTNDLIINRFPSLIMPNNAGTPVIVDSGGPVSSIVTLGGLASGGALTFQYQTQSNFSGYVGSGSLTANIYGLFFYRPLD